MNNLISKQQGFSIVELMVGAIIGLIISYSVIGLYVAQTQTYKTANSQALIQSTENAITNMVTPVIRSAGFTGCGAISNAVSNLNSGGPSPIGTINTVPTLIMGYSGGVSPITLQINPANDSNAGDWTPALDSSLVGDVVNASDVLILLGSVPDDIPISITAIDSTSSSFTLQGTNGTSIIPPQFGAVSDCGKTIIFAITGVTGANLSHSSGAGVLQNATSTFTVNFQPGAQFIVLQQTAFFIGQGQGGDSALMRGILNGSSWTVQPIVPGVELMKVQYGIGSGGVITQYVSADAVPDWSSVYAVRIGFIIAGKLGSGISSTSPLTVLDIPVTVPVDTRLRHVFEMTINLRNALS
ncbi:MAG: PilW family protein [Legionellales bacterium]